MWKHEKVNINALAFAKGVKLKSLNHLTCFS